MQLGRKRTDGPYRWPATLRLPPRPPTLVYLDMLHWIALAKAHVGHPDGKRHEETLAALVNVQASGAAMFPISDSIFFETSQIRQHRQRRDLRDVIELLSQYHVVTSRSVVSTHEIEALLDDLVGPSSRPINGMDYLDWGVARAFGMAGGFRIYDEQGDDITERARLAHPGGPEEFDRLQRFAELELIRNVLAGPPPNEEARMRSLGWRPGNESDVGATRAEQEREQQRRFNADPRWRKGRIRDIVAAREIGIEVNRILMEAVTDRSADLGELFPTPEQARAAFDSMPSFDVAVTLKVAYHEDPNHRWTPNDIHDIDALGSTLPYCDVVVTDKAVASQIRRTGLDERFQTVVLTSTDELPQLLTAQRDHG